MYMKKILYSFLLVFCIVGQCISQNTGIIPTPQHVNFQKGSYLVGNARSCKIDRQIVPSIPIDTNADQGYVLEVTPEGLRLQATSETGLFYGEQSVKQLVRHYSQNDTNSAFEIPCMRIVDFPLMKYRGWMDDISRGPIPNMAFLKSMIATMAEYKMNFFNLYTEHVFKLNRYPDIAPTDGLTAEEVKELEDFAAQYHIEFFGNQQCLAHAEKTLRIPFYQDLADTKTNYNPGNEATYEFLKYQLETVAQAYKSPFFNINSDETEALGSGKARAYVQQNGSASQVYAEHIKRVYDILKRQGKRVMMWGDIAAKDSLITAQLPKDMLMLVWSYAPADSYVSMMEPFEKQHLEFMVAPGMSMWGTVYPSYETYTKNIANLVRDGYQHGAIGMMNTAWDDAGESLINSTWHGMAWAAEMSWQPISNTETTAADKERERRLSAFDENFATQFLHQPTGELFAITELEHTGIPEFFNFSALYDNVLDFYETKVTNTFYLNNLNLKARLETLKGQYPDKLDSHSDAPLNQTAMQRIAHYVCERQQVVTEKNCLRYLIYRMLQGDEQVDLQLVPDKKGNYRSAIKLDKFTLDSRLKSTVEHLHQVKREYMLIWDEECRSYSRDIVEKRFDQAAQDLMNVPSHVFITTDLNEQGEAVVTMRTLYNDRPIYYTIDGRTPQAGDQRYTGPFVLTHSALVQAATQNDMAENVTSQRYVALHKGLQKITKLNTEFSTYRPQYAASGLNALADGIIGGNSYTDGTWQGYWGHDIDVEFDFGKTTTISTFRSRFFQDIFDWIMSPNIVEIYTSKNGKDFTLYRTLQVENVSYSSSAQGVFAVHCDDLSIKARYVRVVVKNGGNLPQWHQASGQPSYIFCDEIILQ